MKEMFLSGVVINPENNKSGQEEKPVNDKNGDGKEGYNPQNRESEQKENKSDDKENGTDENKEYGEKDLEKKYEELKEKLLEHEISCDKIEAVASLSTNGAEEIISIYGVVRLIDAIKKANKNEKDGKIESNMYEVIKILEPDKKKRSEVYDEIYKKIEKELEEMSSYNYNERRELPSFAQEYLPINSNNIMRKKIEFWVMKSVNSRSIDSISKIAAKIGHIVFKEPSSDFHKNSYRQSSLSGHFNTYFNFFNSDEIDLDELKTDLENSDNKEGKIFGATLKNIERAKKEREGLEKEREEFLKELNIKLDKMNEQIDSEFFQKLKDLEDKYPILKDEIKEEIKQKENENYESDSEREQRSHVEEVASKMFEEELLVLMEEYQKEKEEKTIEYHKMIQYTKFPDRSDTLDYVQER